MHFQKSVATVIYKLAFSALLANSTSLKSEACYLHRDGFTKSTHLVEIFCSAVQSREETRDW